MGEVWIVLGGAIFTILGFIPSSHIPSWGWFTLAGLLFLYANLRVYHKLDMRLAAALRDPREIAEIRVMLQERYAAGAHILDGLKEDLGEVYGRGKTEMHVGTRTTHVTDWRAGTREGIKQLLPGRVIEFDVLKSTPTIGYADRNQIRRGADEYDLLRSRLESELAWIEEMRFSAGVAAMWGATKPNHPDPT